MKVQEAAGVTINSIIDSRPKLLAKKNLVGPVLQVKQQASITHICTYRVIFVKP